ncbi:MAG TPA: Holliday junction branch migration protein RuvA [Solirubrobacteraceae bacterium]|nr:Holliday junction branch migration protein RuvA [Solirubrobacteraceae bacterium]
MIAALRGELAARAEGHVVVDCGGVGYRVAVSGETLRSLGPTGSRVTLHTQLFAREDTLSLYGFCSESERELFLLLLGVQAVGPKVALAVLTALPASQLAGALAAGDSALLQSVPGIGKRTAERIVVELREKVGDGGEGAATPAGADRDEHTVAREGLVELGYSAVEADRLLAGVDGEQAADLIGGALKAARIGV